ncbi:hypothetical protein OIU74_013213 [Salix koriyanagi]|uniref:Uncharacterized protein n=1 Tax=Salix koriyanagi TaxID=2511006 RepID=A0A9Q0Q8V8_9ROSI|nr:hypothetical protein OIU74_013213 [Salix koriyanagi]KAJ6702007.1 hypothetical protein OIU74_013213 [Salix koriyanagi]
MEMKHVERRHSIGSLQRRRMCKLKRKNRERKLSRSIEKIRADMVEISEGQKRYFNLSLYLLAKRDGHLLGRSQQQKGKKRKSDGELAKDPKKMKEGLKQDLKNLDKEIAQLSNIVENQENLMDGLLHQLVVHLSLLVRSSYSFP